MHPVAKVPATFDLFHLMSQESLLTWDQVTKFSDIRKTFGKIFNAPRDKRLQDTRETKMIYKMFLAHPATVNESFVQHFFFALRFSALLFAAAFAALVHAFVPCLFEKTASRILLGLTDRIRNRS
jgi:hypothetical protein